MQVWKSLQECFAKDNFRLETVVSFNLWCYWPNFKWCFPLSSDWVMVVLSLWPHHRLAFKMLLSLQLSFMLSLAISTPQAISQVQSFQFSQQSTPHLPLQSSLDSTYYQSSPQFTSSFHFKFPSQPHYLSSQLFQVYLSTLSRSHQCSPFYSYCSIQTTACMNSQSTNRLSLN